MSFINMSHIVDEFREFKWSRYLACYAEHKIMKINHMLDHYENAASSFGRHKTTFKLFANVDRHISKEDV